MSKRTKTILISIASLIVYTIMIFAIVRLIFGADNFGDTGLFKIFSIIPFVPVIFVAIYVAKHSLKKTRSKADQKKVLVKCPLYAFFSSIAFGLATSIGFIYGFPAGTDNEFGGAVLLMPILLLPYYIGASTVLGLIIGAIALYRKD